MQIKRIPLLMALAFLLLLPAQAGAQPARRLRKENAELKSQVESLQGELKSLKRDMHVKDSLLRELTGIFEENDRRSSAGLSPEDYSADVTDSLLSIWYLHRQVNGDSTEDGYSMDSVHFSSNVPDSVFIRRLEKMNSYITLPFNETVRNYIILYTEKMPEKMGNILGLCQYYMPIFEETFSRYGLPDELKYVAIIESALNPVAVSRAGAKGMWQFMTKTGKSYGLEINSYVDERLDPVKSADAAARYMQDSYSLFGDWSLAISSYNCGPGNVNKAIRRAGSRDFWSVYNYLPRETRGYMPAFVGAMYAVNYSKEVGLTPSNVMMPAQVDTFEIRRNVHFRQISEVADIPMDVLQGLNPQFIKDVIPGSSKPYVLRLPFTYSSNFIENEDSIYRYKSEELLNPQTLVSTAANKPAAGSSSVVTYTVRKGDNLGKIASRYHVTVNQLKSWNGLKSDRLQIGQKLKIYGKGSAPAQKASSSKPSSSASTASGTNYTTYTVKSGDTLFKISKDFGVSVDAIMQCNGIGSSIKAGQKIKIPK